MSEKILPSRRNFLRLLGAGLVAASAPDLLKVFGMLRQEGRQAGEDRRLFELSSEFLQRFPEYQPYERVTNNQGHSFDVPESRSHAILEGPEPAMSPPVSHNTFCYRVTNEERAQSTRSADNLERKALEASVLVSEKPPTKNILLLGDSFTLWRDMPLILQQMLELSGFHYAVHANAVLSTGPLEALWRMNYSDFLSQTTYPTEVIHTLHMATDTGPDINEAGRDKDLLHLYPPTMSPVQQAIRATSKRIAEKLFGDMPVGGSSFLPAAIQAYREQGQISTMYEALTSIEKLVTGRKQAADSYSIVLSGDPSLSQKRDYAAIDRFAKEMQSTTKVSVFPMYSEYPIDAYDIYQHPTRAGAIYIAAYLYALITGELFPAEKIRTHIIPSMDRRRDATVAFMEKKLGVRQ